VAIFHLIIYLQNVSFIMNFDICAIASASDHSINANGGIYKNGLANDMSQKLRAAMD
jgi:hypothetical protein